MRLQNMIGLRLAGAAPWLFGAGAAMLAGSVRRHPHLFVAEGTHDQPPADRHWSTLAWVRADAVGNLREAFRQGALAYSQDITLLMRPWGFDLDRVEPRVQLWHGDADRVIPLHHSRYLASVLPNATLQVCEGEGHMVLWNHVVEILSAASGTQPLRVMS